MSEANLLVSTGEIELISITIFPWLNPCATPFSPNSTFSTSGVSGNIVMIMSAFCATCLAETQGFPPCSINPLGMPLLE